MKRIQGFLLGVIVSSLLFGGVLIVSAVTQTIEVSYGVTVVANGVRQVFSDDMRPFTSGGRTFLSVRAISETFDIDVDWDADTSTVYITSDTSAISEVPIMRRDLEFPLHRNFYDIRHTFGNEINSYYDATMEGVYRWYYFDDGLRVGIDRSGTIGILCFDFTRQGNRTAYHFRGIDGTSTYGDVLSMFRDFLFYSYYDYPLYLQQLGIVSSWGYLIEGVAYGEFFYSSKFVMFLFDEYGDVVAIQAYLGWATPHGIAAG